MVVRNLILAACCLFLQVFSSTVIFTNQATAEEWIDVSGKHKVEAEFVSLTEGVVLLKGSKGKLIRIAIEKLDATSQAKARKLSYDGRANLTRALAAGISNARDLEKRANSTRSSAFALKLYESYLENSELESSQREDAKKRLIEWQNRAKEGRLRWGRSWKTVEEIRQSIDEEDRLLKEAHRLIDVGNDKMARERFILASEANPEGLRGDFYLGILDSLLGQHAKSAEKHFSNCVSRLKMSPDRLIGARRSNLVASLNNRAICRVRLGDHTKAMKDWSEAISMAPMTPELVQNLGYYAKLASVVPGWRVSRSAARKVSDEYARITVANQNNKFVENVGWLFIPYIDAPGMPDFADVKLKAEAGPHDTEFLDLGAGAESDYRVVDWATGVAVGPDHLLMARKSVEQAQGLWIRQDGKLRKGNPGKVVAVSGSYDLALVQFENLDANPVPFEKKETTRATEIRAIGFSVPGILQQPAQISEGTVIDLGSVFVPLGKQYLSSEVSHTNLLASGQQLGSETSTMRQTIALPIGKEFVTSIVHDAFLNQGSMGAPLFNLDGKILGIDLDGSMEKKSGGKRNYATNHTEIRAFLESTSLEFPAIDQEPTGPVLDIDEYVSATIDSAVFQVAIVGRVARLSWSDRVGEIRGIKTKEGWNAFEDFWCMRCNGIGQVACPERGCVGGWCSHKTAYVAGYTPAGDPIRKTKYVKERCSRCNASGKLTCPHCGGRKREPSL